MAKTKMLADLFHDSLKDIYFAEKEDPRCAPESGSPSWLDHHSQSAVRQFVTPTKI